MVDATFTPSMRAILASLIGQKLISLECERLETTRETYGNLLITTESQRIELINEEEPTQYFNGIEDLSRFSCRRLETGEEFHQDVMGNAPMKYPIMGTVSKVFLINDHISVQKSDYDIQLSMAVIICTEVGEITFLRGWHFDEMITVVQNTDYHFSLRSIRQIQSDWCDDPNLVTVERSLVEL